MACSKIPTKFGCLDSLAMQYTRSSASSVRSFSGGTSAIILSIAIKISTAVEAILDDEVYCIYITGQGSARRRRWLRDRSCSRLQNRKEGRS
jgi:hypothetical protein